MEQRFDAEKAKRKIESTVLIDDDEGCWIWTGAIGDGGPRVLRKSYGEELVARLSYRAYVGELTDAPVLTCGNKSCVNPGHLFNGSVSEAWISLPVEHPVRLNVVDRWKASLMANSRLDNETGCWEWLGGKNKKGYGSCSFYSGESLAHRTAYKIFKGPVEKGLFVLHSCDNPGCINPEHLSTGTHEENTLDMLTKGRQKRKLNDEAIEDILSSSESSWVLAKKYGVTPRAIRWRRQINAADVG